MRRFTIGFAVVVMMLLLASVAGAVPPGFCDGHQDHPYCTTTEPPLTTAPPQPEACPTETWTIEGNALTSWECLWRPINDGSEIATVTISDITGAIKTPPVVFVRDDSPGDICLLVQGDEWDPPTEDGHYTASFDLFYDEVPEGYEAWLGHSYWDFVYDPEAIPSMETGTHWCAPQDPVLDSLRYDTNGGALHVVVSFNAKKGGSLKVTLAQEEATP